MAQAGDELERLLLVADVERARRLVEQQDRRLLGEGTGDHDALPLAAAQRAEAPIGGPTHVEAFQHAGHNVTVVTGRGAEVGDVRRAAEQHVFERRHVVGHQRYLRHVGDRAPLVAGRTGRRG